MKLYKFPLILVLVVAWYAIWSLPTGRQLDLSDQLDSLPDHDLRTMAEEFWHQGQEDSAMIVLDYVIEQDMGDKPAAVQLRNDYLKQLAQRTTPMGRAKAAGWGLVSGNVNSWESLAGSTVGDLVVYGDLRDITRELVFESDSDGFVVTLSALGLATTLFPPADPAVAIVKGLKKSEALTGTMITQLGRIGKAINETSDTSKQIQHLREGLLPFYDLSKHTSTWSDYTTLIKHTDSLDQVKAITNIAARQPGNARKLTQILSVAGKNGMDGSNRTLALIMTHGQKGLDTLYAALRKGPRGLKFVADNPVLVARGLKNIRKSYGWGINELIDWARSAGLLAVVVKAGVLAVLSVILCRLVVPRWVLQRVLPSTESSGDYKRAVPSALARVLGQPVGLALGAGAVIFMLVLIYTGPSRSESMGGDLRLESGAGDAPGSNAAPSRGPYQAVMRARGEVFISMEEYDFAMPNDRTTGRINPLFFTVGNRRFLAGTCSSLKLDWEELVQDGNLIDLHVSYGRAAGDNRWSGTTFGELLSLDGEPRVVLIEAGLPQVDTMAACPLVGRAEVVTRGLADTYLVKATTSGAIFRIDASVDQSNKKYLRVNAPAVAIIDQVSGGDLNGTPAEGDHLVTIDGKLIGIMISDRIAYILDESDVDSIRFSLPVGNLPEFVRNAKALHEAIR